MNKDKTKELNDMFKQIPIEKIRIGQLKKIFSEFDSKVEVTEEDKLSVYLEKQIEKNGMKIKNNTIVLEKLEPKKFPIKLIASSYAENTPYIFQLEQNEVIYQIKCMVDGGKLERIV